MSFENIKADLSEGVLTITINREKKLNALNTATILEIETAVDDAQTNPEVKGIILTGAGEKAFVAGADISELTNLDAAQAEELSKRGHRIFAKLENSKKPTIAAVNGYALGGGCEIAMACHMRVASENAIFGLPEVTLGLIPGYGGTQRLTQLVGKGKAIELMTTADKVSADDAKAFGLVNHVVALEELQATCQKIMSKIFRNAPLAVGMAIESANAFYTGNGYDTEAKSFGDCCQTEDFKEGTTAFLEKRRASFQGK